MLTQITVKMPEELRARVVRTAEADRRDVSNFVRKVLEDAVRKSEAAQHHEAAPA